MLPQEHDHSEKEKADSLEKKDGLEGGYNLISERELNRTSECLNEIQVSPSLPILPENLFIVNCQ